MQPLVSSLKSCFIRCKQSDIGGLLFLLNGVTNAHLVVYPVPMICEAYFDCPVGTGPVSVPTGVNTTVHAGFCCILEFSYMFSALNSAPLNPREGLPMDLQGDWMFLLALPVPPAPSFWYSIRILTMLTPFIPPSAPSSQPKNLAGSTCAAPSSTATWKSPTSKCRRWRSECMWNE